jgi:hypothetical protein
MTIQPGQAWGRRVPRPPDLEIVDGDAELGAALSGRHERPIAVVSGDLARTVGVDRGNRRSPVTNETINRFTIDLIEVFTDGAAAPIIACAHVVVRAPWYRAHWLRGPILAVMNAEFIGEWDLAPRGHPNDGRVEVIEVDAAMTLRDRLAARRRIRTGTHVPHPRISTRSVRSASWTFDRPLEVIIDGRRAGRASALSVKVIADAASIHA